MSGFAPKKQFSQNFLTDVSIAKNIVRQLLPATEDCILEVGPGKGALTTLLLETLPHALVAVDIDPRAVDYVRLQPWAASPNFSCVMRDALSVNVQELFPNCPREHRKIIGNIPYSITSELLFWAFSQHQHASRVVFMMQREVAKRCVAGPGTKDYGILSVASWFYSEPRIAFVVQPGSFFPRPEVTSAVITFSLRPTLPFGLDAAPFMSFVRAAFSQRRKVMTNSLADWANRNRCDLRSHELPCGKDLSRTRAEELTPQELATVYIELSAGRGLSL